MPVFECCIEIEGERTALFELTQDYSRRLSWDPFLKEARLVNARERMQAGVGARAWCVSRSGIGMETEYVAWDPPNVAAVVMTRGPWFLEQFAGSWRFDCVDATHTRVTFRYNLKGRPVQLTPLLMAVFARDTRRRLVALKRAAV